MILFYIDEGGTGWKDIQTDFFFLVSFAIPPQNWSQMDRDVLSLKKSLLSADQLESWELKGHDIWQGKGKFKNVKWEYRVRDFLKVSETLNHLPCHIFTVQGNSKSLRNSREQSQDDTELYQFAFRQLLEDIDAFLTRSNKTAMLLIVWNSLSLERLLKVNPRH